MRRRRIWRAAGSLALAAVLLTACGTALAETEERLPESKTGEYSFYLSEKTPYIRLSPHRSETVDSDGKKQPRRIAALYALADLRRYGGQSWSPGSDAGSPAYSGSPAVTVRSGSRYAMYSPEQAGFTAEISDHLRAIVLVSYPFCSAERMRTILVEAGALEQRDGIVSAKENFSDGTVTETVTESELLSAVQTAIWRVAGSKGSILRVYTETESAGRTERTLQSDPYRGEAASYAQTENNIRAISDYLVSLGVGTSKADMPLTAMSVAAIHDAETDCVTLRIRPNGTINDDDSLLLEVGGDSYALAREDGERPVLLPDADGCYTLLLSGLQAGESVSVSLSGVQHTTKDVCVYVPQDGDAGQSLVGVFGGTVDVSLQQSVSFDTLDHRVRLRCVTHLIENGPEIPLSDAVFSLCLSDATNGLTRIVENLVTDAEGIVEVSGLCDLKDGENYVFVQTAAPAGYLLPKEQRVYADAAAAVHMRNMPAHTAAARLTLVDDHGTGMDAVPFALYRMFGLSDSVLLGEYTTDAAGQIEMDALAAGAYRFVQQTVPDGYAAETTEYPFAITSEGNDVKITAKNHAYRTIDGSVRFMEGDPPQSVLVKLLRDGELCAEQTVSADTGWKYRFSDIPVLGDYEVVQDVLAGYAAQRDAAGIINHRRRTDIVLRQQTDGDQTLRGAVFSLHSAVDGSHVCTVSSDVSGSIRFPDLAVGGYVLRERRAPSGIRQIGEDMILIVSDPNTSMDQNKPLQAELRTEEGIGIEGLALERHKDRFFGLGLRGVLLLLVGTMTAAAIGITILRRCQGKSLPVRLYSGKTKLYLMKIKRQPWIRRILQKG